MKGYHLAVVSFFFCLRLLVFVAPRFLVAAPKTETWYNARATSINIPPLLARCIVFRPSAAAALAVICRASPYLPRLTPPCGRCKTPKPNDYAKVGSRTPSPGGGRPKPHPKAVPRLRCEHANCRPSPQGYMNGSAAAALA